MARVQLSIPDEEHARFAHQARTEGMSLSAWLRAAASEHLVRRSPPEQFESRADIERFFAECDAREGPGVEPDWERHLEVITESRHRGAARHVASSFRAASRFDHGTGCTS